MGILKNFYTRMQGANAGVVGMVEVTQSEFGRPETMTEVAKAQTQKEHDEFRTTPPPTKP